MNTMAAKWKIELAREADEVETELVFEQLVKGGLVEVGERDGKRIYFLSKRGMASIRKLLAKSYH